MKENLDLNKTSKYETACLFCGSTTCHGECLVDKIKSLPKEKQQKYESLLLLDKIPERYKRRHTSTW